MVGGDAEPDEPHGGGSRSVMVDRDWEPARQQLSAGVETAGPGADHGDAQGPLGAHAWAGAASVVYCK